MSDGLSLNARISPWAPVSPIRQLRRVSGDWHFCPHFLGHRKFIAFNARESYWTVVWQTCPLCTVTWSGRRTATWSANECLIATHAILGGMPLLHRDRDFDLIAGVEPKLILVAVGK